AVRRLPDPRLSRAVRALSQAASASPAVGGVAARAWAFDSAPALLARDRDLHAAIGGRHRRHLPEHPVSLLDRHAGKLAAAAVSAAARALDPWMHRAALLVSLETLVSPRRGAAGLDRDARAGARLPGHRERGLRPARCGAA